MAGDASRPVSGRRGVRAQGATLSPNEAPIPLIGRRAELQQLLDVLDTARNGPAAVAFLEGEPGIGKSRLLAEVLAEASRRGFSANHGRAEELESGRPFAAIAEALGCTRTSADPSRARIARLIAGDDVLTSNDQREAFTEGAPFRIQEEILDLIETIALRGPTVVAIDDLQWADEATLGVLRAITRRLPHLPVAVLGTLRPIPKSTELTRLIAAATGEGARHLLVHPLPPIEVEELITALLGAPAADRLLDEVAGAGGNPLFVSELLNALEQEGAIEFAEGRADVGHVSLPPTLRLTILRRISFLPDATLDTLRVASILGSSFSPAEAGIILGRSTLEVLSDFRPALDSSVLIESDADLSFRHDLIRQAIYDDLPAPVRAAYHEEAARALERSGAAADRVAQHLLLGVGHRNHQTVEMLRRVADQLWTSTKGLSLALLRRALEIIPPADPRRDDILLRMINPLARQGYPAEAREIALELLGRVSDPALRPLIRIGVVFSTMRLGRPSLVIEELEPWLSAPDASEEERIAIAPFVAQAHLFTGDVESAERILFRSAEIAQRIGNHASAVDCLRVLVWTAASRGEVPLILARIDQAASERVMTGRTGDADVYHGTGMIEADRFEEARTALGHGYEYDARRGDVNVLANYHWALGGMHYYAGGWDEAIAEIEAGLGLMSEGVTDRLGVLYGCAFGGLIAARRDDLARAANLLAQGESWSDESGIRLGFDLLSWLKTVLLEARGEDAAAYETLSSAWDLTAPTRYLLSWRMIAPELVRLALAHGDIDRARSVVETAEEGARLAGGVPSADGAALRCRALLEGNADTMLAAAEAFRRSPRRPDLASACEDAGVLLAQAGKPDAARPLFDEAVEIYQDIGAVRDGARAAAAMRAAGLRRGSRGVRRRPTSGWESLTPTERDVVRLTVQGLSNPQIAERLFISKHTVRSHLAHVFTKLSVTSRVELAMLATRHEPEMAGG